MAIVGKGEAPIGRPCSREDRRPRMVYDMSVLCTDHTVHARLGRPGGILEARHWHQTSVAAGLLPTRKILQRKA